VGTPFDLKADGGSVNPGSVQLGSYDPAYLRINTVTWNPASSKKDGPPLNLTVNFTGLKSGRTVVKFYVNPATNEPLTVTVQFNVTVLAGPIIL